jgi:hypothetical protein
MNKILLALRSSQTKGGEREKFNSNVVVLGKNMYNVQWENLHLRARTVLGRGSMFLFCSSLPVSGVKDLQKSHNIILDPDCFISQDPLLLSDLTFLSSSLISLYLF